MWNDGRQLELHDRVPELVVHRIVPVGDAREAGEHHAAQAARLDPLEIRDPVLGRAHRGLAESDQPLGRERAELGDPLVVRAEAGGLVVAVGVVAEDHPDRRVHHLCAHAVDVLVREARFGIPTAAVQLVEGVAAVEPDLLGRSTGRGDEPHRHERLAVVHEHDVAERLVVLEARRAVAVRGIDAVDVRARRLGDVRVGRDADAGCGRGGHASLPSSCGHRVHVEVVAPERDLAVAHLEDSGDGEVGRHVTLDEPVRALVEHEVSRGHLLVHDPFDAGELARHRTEDALDPVGAEHLAHRHVVVLDVVGHELARGVEIEAHDARDEFVDDCFGGHLRCAPTARGR